MFKLRPYRRGREKSNLLAMVCQEGTCGPDCMVIVFQPNDTFKRGGKMVPMPATVAGIVHAPKCVGKDYYSDSFLDAVYHGEVPGAPEKIKKRARDMTAHVLLAEIVRSGRNGHDYKRLLSELKPLIKDSPEVQEMIRDLTKELS